MKSKTKLLIFICAILSATTVSGLVYGALYPFPNLQTRPISWSELETMMGPEKGTNIRKITCACRFFPTPDTNSLIVELKSPVCERTISASELPTTPIGTSCGTLQHDRPLLNKRLAWLFEQARIDGVDLMLKAHAPVNGAKYVEEDLIKDGKPTSSYATGVTIAGPQRSKAPWLREM